VVKEELALHKEEREIMEKPAEDEEPANPTIPRECACKGDPQGQRMSPASGREGKKKLLTPTVVEILVTSLRAEDQNPSNDSIGYDRRR
jgi:hypothetical protein